jgi:hypothetical protein
MTLVKPRSMLISGLRLVFAHPAAVVWTYVFNLGIALLFALPLHARLASLLDHSMAAQGLSTGFDLGVLLSAFTRLNYRVPSQGATVYLGLPLYFLIYFLLVPGALFSYRIGSRQRLATLLGDGLLFFWRFVRIALLTALISGLVLAPLLALENAWAAHVDEHVVGVAALYHQVPGWTLILLVASLLRLYFDLVEVYTVQLDGHFRPNGKPDRRVRRTLIPAAKTLWRNLPRALGSFILIALLGLAAVFFTGRTAVEMLAQPRVWPAFLLVQLGLYLNLLTRYWQRGAETILAADYPLLTVAPPEDGPDDAFASSYFAEEAEPIAPSPSVLGTREDPLDAQPNPEPPVPPEDLI